LIFEETSNERRETTDIGFEDVVGGIEGSVEDFDHGLLFFFCAEDGLEGVSRLWIFGVVGSLIEDGDDVRVVYDATVVFDEFDCAPVHDIFH
jgi:hypothetical protein